jgi:hypothetical protein
VNVDVRCPRNGTGSLIGKNGLDLQGVAQKTVKVRDVGDATPHTKEDNERSRESPRTIEAKGDVSARR